MTELPPGTEYTAVTAREGYSGPLPELSGMRIANFSGEERYFLLYGTFAFPEQQEIFGTILVSSTGELLRAWPVEVEEHTYLGPHIGLALSDDGLIATNAYGVASAHEWCGDLAWTANWAPWTGDDWNGPDSLDWHHDISFHDGQFITFRGMDTVALDASTGEIVWEILGTDLYHWSWDQGLSLMDARGRMFWPEQLDQTTAGRLLPADPFHVNKVDVLEAAEADNYPGLEAGDLLFSFRDLNLVAVVRPSEERFVWWRYGLTSRQHDSTYVDGAIEIFDNARFTDNIAIRRLSIDDHDVDTVFELDQWGIDRMGARGNFTRDGDRLLVSDDDAGRMIAGRIDGTMDVVFENGFSADGKPLVRLSLRNAIELDPALVERFEADCQALDRAG